MEALKKDDMHSYLRQWNKEGDYIELPPYSIKEDRVEVFVFENCGDLRPVIFEFDKEDLEELIQWAQSMIPQLKDRID